MSAAVQTRRSFSLSHEIVHLCLEELTSPSGVAQRLRHVSCTICQGVATLQGHLPSWFLKQLAQSLVQKAPGVRVVVNRIEVIEQSALLQSPISD